MLKKGQYMKKILLLTLAVIAQSMYQLRAESYCKLFQISSNSIYCLIEQILTNDDNNDRKKAFENLESKLAGILSENLKSESKSDIHYTGESRANLLVSSFKTQLAQFDSRFTNELAGELLGFIEYQIVVPTKKGKNIAKYKEIADNIETLEKKNPTGPTAKAQKAQIEKQIATLESKWDELAEKEAQTDKEIKKFMADMSIILSNQMKTKKVSKDQSKLLRQANLAKLEQNELWHAKITNAVQTRKRKGQPLF